MLVLIILSVFIAGCAKAVSDISSNDALYKASRLFNLNPDFWLKSDSWDNKWREPIIERRVEKFPGSSTVFVFLSDAWHLFNAITYSCLILAAVFAALSGVKIDHIDWKVAGYLFIAFAGLKLIFSIGFRCVTWYLMNNRKPENY